MDCQLDTTVFDRPDNEVARLEKLHGLDVLDTAPESGFDQIVSLVQSIFNVETALVSLVDKDRQWFKARIGLDAEETDRDVAFCNHAILQSDVFVVSDARLDHRFCDNPLVTGAPHIRFYAGAPLITSDGFALGTLCMIDSHPHLEFSDQDRLVLSELASVVTRLLEAKRDTQDRRSRLKREALEHAKRTSVMAEVLQTMSQGAVLVDEQGRCEFVSDRVPGLIGLDAASMGEVFNIETLFEAGIEKGLLTESVVESIYSATRDAEEITVHIRTRKDRIIRVDMCPRVGGGMIGTLTDVTEERQQQQALNHSNNQLQLMVDNIPAFVFHKDSDNNILRINASAAKSLELPVSEIEGRHCDELYEKEISDKYYRDDCEVIASGQPKLGIIEQYLPKEGTRRWLSTDKIPYTDPDTGEQQIFVVATDISAQREAEDGAKRQLKKLENIYNSAPALMHTLDPAGRITSVSDFWIETLGYNRDEVIGQNFRKFLHDSSDDPFAPHKVKTFVETGIMRDDALRLVNKSGAAVDVLASSVAEYAPDGSVELMIGVLTDVTERLKAERQLHQSQKMESVGQLTSGLAHDFNNLLSVIVGNLQLIERSVEDEKSLRRIGAALSAAESGADLTRSLLDFSRKRDVETTQINLVKALGKLDTMLRRLIGERITLETQLPKHLPDIIADPAQFESALINLCVNARDAMPEGGQLRIGAKSVFLDADFASREDCKPGDYIKVSVTDSGSGMDEETLQKVLEPFFSTKPKGRGTGLGLSMVYGFTKQSGGLLKLYSEPGQGTTVSLYLKVSEEAAKRPSKTETPQLDSYHATGRILVVEDQEGVRDVAVGLLEEFGFVVETASSGDEAMKLLRCDRAFDLVFSDIVMPGDLDGVALSREAAKLYPDLPFLFATGYADASLLRSGNVKATRNLVDKPYRRRQLAAKISDILSQSPEKPAIMEKDSA